jgi:hypothetical protein
VEVTIVLSSSGAGTMPRDFEGYLILTLYGIVKDVSGEREEQYTTMTMRHPPNFL